MNLKELAVLNTINQAGHLRREFWATAKEIRKELTANKYLVDERRVLMPITVREIGYLLRRMASDPRLCIRGEVLVEKRRVRGTNQWRATHEAIKACIV